MQVLGMRVVDEVSSHCTEQLHRLRAGVFGEERLRQIFEKYKLPFSSEVLFDVNLEAGGKFQADCVVLSETVCVILESKNISGSLRFEHNPSCLIRERQDGQIDIFESPDVQLQRNCWLMERWLAARQIQLPVTGAIVWTSATRSNIIKPPTNVQTLYVQTVPIYLKQVTEQFRLNATFLSHAQLLRISKEMQQQSKQCKYPQFPLSQRWNITAEQIKKGVRCIKCGEFGMDKMAYGWTCHCGHIDKHAHKIAIKEWFMLVKETMTNKECREFLLLEDRYVAKRMLKSCDLIEIGTTKGTIYKWKW